MRRISLVALLVCLLGLAAWAAPGLEVAQKLEQSESPLPFGKPATLVIDLSWDEQWSFKPPAADKLELKGLTILDAFTTTPPQRSDGRKAITYNLVFTRFEPGQATIPAVAFETPNGEAESKPLSIEYKGAEARDGDKPDQLRGPKDVTELSTRDFWVKLAKGVGIALLVLLLISVLVRKLGLLDRWLSPRSRALRQLGQLSKALTKNHKDGDSAVLEMVEILRVYLRKAHGMVTREATSKEIAQQLTMSNECGSIKPVAKTLLEHGDAAKFARRKTSEGEARDLLESLKSALDADKARSKAKGTKS